MAVGPFWYIVLPTGDRANLMTNPSFERGTAGWSAIQGAAVGSTADYQRFGAWCGSVAPTSNGTSGAKSPSFTLGNGTTYTVSFWARTGASLTYRAFVSDTSGVYTPDGFNNGSITWTGGGTWHRYSFPYGESTGATHALCIKKDGGGNTGLIALDGVQVEPGSITTYIDGDQEGCYWTGVAHTSSSVRNGTFRGGGSVISLQSLGWIVDEEPGIGMSAQDITAVSYAIVDGDQYQRSRQATRSFSLQTTFIGTSIDHLHTTRRTVFSYLLPTAYVPQQPVRFWYTGAQGTVSLDAVYQAGGELTKRDGFSEITPIRFVAHDPYFYAPTQEGTALAPRVALGSANYIVKRDGRTGQWGTLGQNGGSVNGAVYTILVSGGTAFLGGEFGSAAGTASRGVVQYYQDTNTFGSMTNGSIGGTAFTLLLAPWGSLFVGGTFAGAGGTAGARHLAQWNGAWGTLVGGTVENGPVRALQLNSYGTMFIGGDFTQIAGTSNRYVARWFNNAFGSLTSGSVDNTVNALRLDATGRLYIGGFFVGAHGTTANGIAQWTGDYGTLSTGLQAGGVTTLAGAVYVTDFLMGADQRLYVGGHFGSLGGGSAQHIGVWNGISYSALANGLGTTGNTSSAAWKLQDDLQGGFYVGGVVLGTNAGPTMMPDAAMHWNGYAWLPLDINLNGVGYIYGWGRGADNTLYAGGSFAGTAQAASVTTVVNSSMGEAYPVFRARSTAASGTVRIYQLVNTLTGDGLYFNNLVILPGEQIEYVSTPGRRSLTSSMRGTIFGQILPGSNIAGFRLLPGTNYVSFFADSDNLVTSFFWTPRHASADGGTIA